MTCRPFARVLLSCAALALAPALASAQIACNDTLGPGGRFTLDSELRCVGTGLTLVGPVSLDLAGQRVQCLSRSTGILLRGKGVRLSNGEVRNCADGIRVEGEGRHRLEALIVIGSRGDGVDVRSPSNRIEDVVVVDAEGDGFAIRAEKQRIERAHALRVGGRGFSVEGSGNRIEESLVESSGENGLRLAGDANRVDGLAVSAAGVVGALVTGNGNRIDDSMVVGTLKGQGVHVVGDSNRLAGNTVAGGEDPLNSGITLTGDENRQQGNRVHANAAQGLILRGDDNQAKRNHAYGNGHLGLLVSGSEGRIHDNTIFASGDDDAADDDPDCSSNRWTNNRFGSARNACIE